MAWKKGLGQKDLKEKYDQKGKYYSKGEQKRVSYLKSGVLKSFVPRDGDNRIRVIQPIEIDIMRFWGFETHFHRSVGIEGALEGSEEADLFGDYLCMERMGDVLAKIYGQSSVPTNKCYRCEERSADLWESDPALAKTYYPDRRYQVLVLDLLSENPKEVLRWSAPWSLIEEIVSRSSNKETGEYIDVSDPFTGPLVSFDRAGKGVQTKYTNVQVFSSPMPLEESVADQRVGFKDFIIIPDYETLKRACLSETGEIESNQNQNIGKKKDYGDDVPSFDDVQIENIKDQKLPDCYKIEFDKWEDCDTCEFAASCAPEPEPEPEPERKPKRTPKTTPKATDDGNGKEKIEAIKADMRKKINAARVRK